MKFKNSVYKNCARSSTHSGGIFDTPLKRKRILEIDAISQSDPNFWNDRKKSSGLLKEKKSLEDGLKVCENLSTLIEDCAVALEFAEEEESYEQEAEETLVKIETQLDELERRRLLGEEADGNSAIITINSGAGGTEACDWAEMVMRMMLRYCEKQSWKTEIVDILDGESAGIKNATINVDGEFAYGLLKSEIGVHRLVRISPYDSNKRRHTSFCSVFVSPVVDDSIEIEVKTADLRIDTFRAGGAGGQHVNRTDSAVRITHTPTGIVVQSQSQRSQIQNREMCMRLLKAKLYELEMQKRMQATQQVENTKQDNAFGSQIRSYVLHPYKLVKDARTHHQNSNPTQVLDGDLMGFSVEYLRQYVTGEFKGKGGDTSEEDNL